MVEDRHCIFGEHPLLKPGRPQHAPSPWPCRCCSAAGQRSNRRLVEACCDPSHHGFQQNATMTWMIWGNPILGIPRIYIYIYNYLQYISIYISLSLSLALYIYMLIANRKGELQASAMNLLKETPEHFSCFSTDRTWHQGLHATLTPSSRQCCKGLT